MDAHDEKGNAEGEVDKTASKASAKLNSVGTRTIELYQNQRSQLDRLWAYLNQYSALLLIIGGVLAVYLNSEARPASRWLMLVIPPVVYLAFALGNRRAISLTLTELRIIRNITVTKTPYTFKEVNKEAALRLHSVSVAFVLVMYTVIYYLAR